MTGEVLSPPSGSLNPLALSAEDMARVLTAAIGETVRSEMIAADIAAGAPTNADGTLNLVRYAAWLLSQAGR